MNHSLLIITFNNFYFMDEVRQYCEDNDLHYIISYPGIRGFGKTWDMIFRTEQDANLIRTIFFNGNL